MNMAVPQLQPAPHSRVNASRGHARRYLLVRQSPSGGFCFYRSTYVDEPNLGDTWHAVAALLLLGELPPHREALFNFVCAQPIGRQLYALYYRTFTLEALGSADPDRAAMEASVRALALKLRDFTPHSHVSGQLERLLFTLQLKAYFKMTFAADEVAAAMSGMEQRTGGFGFPPNIIDTQLALSILSLCGHKASARTTEFVSRLAGPGYAFRLTENSLSPNLEIVCAGIGRCEQAGMPVPYSADAAAFILACQTGNGGFARAPNALPDIKLTHLALQGLASLSGNTPSQQPRPQSTRRPP